MSQPPLRIAIAGLGTVGTGTLRLLQENADLLTARSGRALQVTAVSSRNRSKDRGVDVSGLTWVDQASDLASLESVDIIVEAIGGTQGPAADLVVAALKAGKPVVTANKALLAERGQELKDLVQAHQAQGAALAYEAAVAGGIPAIKGVREGLAANQFKSIYGILNGTCNYILTQMRETGRDFAEVLTEAQELGYAEADPSFDVDGIDAAHKLAILASLAFGSTIDFSAVKIDGIRSITAEDISFSEDFGYRIKLIGYASMLSSINDLPSRLVQWVRPCLVAQESSIAGVDGVHNAVVAKGDFVGEVMLRGPGAGAGPTASAIVADLIDYARGNNPPLFGLALGDSPALADSDAWLDTKVGFYLRLCVQDQPGVLAALTQELSNAGLSVASMRQPEPKRGEPATIALVTHEATWRQAMPALDRLNSLPFVLEPVQSLHIITL